MVLPLHCLGGGLRLVCAHEACHDVQRRHLRWILGLGLFSDNFLLLHFVSEFRFHDVIIIEKPRIDLAHFYHRWSPADHREFHGKQADADELHV